MKERTLKKKYYYDLISISHFFYPKKGGLENMAYKLLNDLSKQGHNIIAIHGGEGKDKTYKLNNYTVKVFKTKDLFDGTYPIFTFRFFRYIYKLINNNPNAKIIIHSRHLTSSFLASFACVISGKKYFLIEHTANTSFVKNQFIQGLVHIYENTFSKFVVTRAKKIITVSKAGKKHIREKYKIEERRITVTYNGFEIKELKEFIKTKKEKKIVFAGKMIKVKNPKIVFEAFKILAPKYSNWKFFFIGDGGFFKPQKTKIKNLKIINKMIPRKRLLNLFSSSSIYINSSLSEGLSLTILEAAYLKNIPVLSDAPSNVEVAKNLETSKYIFKKHELDSLTKKIELAIKESGNKKYLKSLQNKTEDKFNNCNLFRNYSNLFFPREKHNFKKLSIIIPAYNEEKTILKILNRVLTLQTDLKKEIIIVNDCSKDNTKDLIQSYKDCKKKQNCTYKIINNDRNIGKTQSVKRGIRVSTGDLVVIQDADLEYNPENLVSFVEIFKKNPYIDVIYGNRFHKNNKQIIYQSYYWGNRILTKISNFFTIPRGLKVNDMEVCYKMAKGDLFRKIGKQIESQSSFGLEPELTAKFAKKKVYYWEIPIEYTPRTINEGKKIKIFKDGSSALWEIIKFNFLSKQ